MAMTDRFGLDWLNEDRLRRAGSLDLQYSHNCKWLYIGYRIL
jgi:hypothetical protein